MMIKSILVPVDGSENSSKALSIAVDIAEKHEAELSVLFVASRETFGELQNFTDYEYNQCDESAILAACEQMGKRMISRMIGEIKTSVMTKSIVLFGNPVDRIVEYYKKKAFDMVVMGNRGLSNIKGMVMGSVSRKVSKLIDCTFVSVK